MAARNDERRGAVRIGYFSMEIGLRSELPTYSGGLGVLAGDTVRAAADLGLPFAAVTLVHREGYFRQTLDPDGRQGEAPASWDPARHLEPVPGTVSLFVDGRDVRVRAWRLRVRGIRGDEVPVYFLDTDVPGNRPRDRRITDRLYGGDLRDRLRQEAVLGLGGAALLRRVEGRGVETFHMNEGHSALLVLALLEEELEGPPVVEAVSPARAAERVRARCVFTTHTPVQAGHDVFPLPLAEEVLGPEPMETLRRVGALEGGELHMTRLALHFSRFCNGVSMRHARVSQEMFPGSRVHAITNGVHAATWTGKAVRTLFDEEMPGWREDPFLLRHAAGIPEDRIRAAHARAKEALLAEVARRTGQTLLPDRLTIGFARRAAPYKRADLLLDDPDRLGEIARGSPGLQVVYAGKAHPRDGAGQEMIRRVVGAAARIRDDVPLVYLEDYDMELGALLTSGVDLWLNTPEKPLEASGTSGMKAALNGVPSLSVLDGWWIEGHAEGVTGWAVGDGWREPSDRAAEARSLLDLLEGTILPLFYRDEDGWSRVMRAAVALNGSHFHARRMMQEYVDRAYRTGGPVLETSP